MQGHDDTELISRELVPSTTMAANLIEQGINLRHLTVSESALLPLLPTRDNAAHGDKTILVEQRGNELCTPNFKRKRG